MKLEIIRSEDGVDSRHKEQLVQRYKDEKETVSQLARSHSKLKVLCNRLGKGP